MYFIKNKNIQKFRRDSTKLKKKNFIYLDANEGIENFNKKILLNIFKKITPNDFIYYPNNYQDLYSKLAKWLKLRTSQILLTNGADDGLRQILSMYLNPNDKVVYYRPSYNMYEIYFKIFKSKKYPYELNVNSKKKFRDLKNFIYKVKPKLVVLANPNQPFEIIITEKEIREICLLTNKLNCILILDEAYYHFNNITGIKNIKYFNNIFIIRTFSKAFGLAGIRAGYIISAAKNIDYLKTLKSNYEINNLNKKILLFFLNNLEIMKDYVKKVKESIKLFYILFKKNKRFNITGNYANFLLLDFREKNDVDKIYNIFLKKKIFLKRVIFKKKKYIRITFGNKKYTIKIANLIKQFYKKK